ncbi:MAG: hypothetical protein JW940_15480 [Polyangiaceae bacterium]|nr:hypothetical protein [Polyangiaceae bacterium]
MQSALLGTRAALLWLVALLAGCGGETGDSDGSKSPTSGGAMAMDGGSGGSFSTGGTGGSPNSGGTGAVLRETGGMTNEPQDDECKYTALYNAIRVVAVGEGQCVLWLEEPPEGFDLTPYHVRGAVVLDSEGRIVEVFGSGYLRRLGSDASESWPCYANQTIQYACEPSI